VPVAEPDVPHFDFEHNYLKVCEFMFSGSLMYL